MRYGLGGRRVNVGAAIGPGVATIGPRPRLGAACSRVLLSTLLPAMLAYTSPAMASTAAANSGVTPSATVSVVRQLRVGVSVLHALAPGKGLGPGLPPTGLGLASVYQYQVSPRSVVGIKAAYHGFGKTTAPSAPQGRLHQLNYGLRLAHTLPTTAGVQPYVAYGLLMQMLKQEGRQGAPTAHDTELALGLDTIETKGRVWYLELSYHYSVWRPYDAQGHSLSFVSLGVGASLL